MGILLEVRSKTWWLRHWDNSTLVDALPVDEAIEFLRECLSSGPMGQKDVKAAAKRAGIKERTLYRAKKELEVRSHKLGYGDSWAWSLKE